MGLCSRLGRVRPTAWHHSPTSAPSQRVRFHFHAALLLDARRLWIVGCGSRFCMRCRTFGVVMVCIMSSSHSMCIITAGGSRVTICGRVLGARVGSGAGPVPRPGATGPPSARAMHWSVPCSSAWNTHMPMLQAALRFTAQSVPHAACADGPSQRREHAKSEEEEGRAAAGGWAIIINASPR